MNVLVISGFVMDTFGVLIIAYMSLRVHHRFTHEHKVDEVVFRAMKREQRYGFIGMALIIIGSLMQLVTMLSAN
jgi:hypothetical protein